MIIASEKQPPRVDGAAEPAPDAAAAVHAATPGPAFPVASPPAAPSGAAPATPSAPPTAGPESPVLPESEALERAMRRIWASLAVASLACAAGLALTVTPLLRSDVEPLWPGARQHLWLFAALPLGVMTLVVGLTWRLRRLLSWRRTLDQSLQRRVESAGLHAETITHEMHDLENGVEARRQAERTLQATAETLQHQLAKEKHETERRQQLLAEVKRIAEIQNVRLRQQNRMAHEFISLVAHEFRAPLSVIREHATTMKEELVGDVTPEQYKYLETIISRVDDVIFMVNDAVDMSSLEANTLVALRHVCGADEVVNGPRDVLERKAAAAGVTLAVQLDPGLPALFCDPDKAGRVLVNLGVNAIKSSDPGQTVEIWCRRSNHPAEVVLGITDHGPGLAPEHLESISNGFEQVDRTTHTSAKGFDLRLTIVRELVHLNFGRVVVQSAVGKGSSFSFTLPVAEPHLLLPLYIERVKASRRGGRAVSLLSVCTETSCDTNAHEEIHRFLVGYSRRTDLVVATATGRWLIVATTDRAGTDRMLERLARGWSNMDTVSHANLPTLQWRIAGCFDAETRIDDLVRSFLAISQSDPATVLPWHPPPAQSG